MGLLLKWVKYSNIVIIMYINFSFGNSLIRPDRQTLDKFSRIWWLKDKSMPFGGVKNPQYRGP